MNPLANLTIKIVDAVPEEFLIEQIEISLRKFKAEKTDDNKAMLVHSCAMMLTKSQIAQGGAEKMQEKLQNYLTTKDMFGEFKKN